MKIKLNKGNHIVDLGIPDEKIVDILIGKDVPAVGHDNLSRVIEQGLESHLPDDIEKKIVAVIIPDDTRLWARGDLFVPLIIKTLERKGVPKENIRIIIAIGTHADIGQDRFADLAGPYCAQHIQILNGANRNKERLVDLGTTHKGTKLTLTKEAVQADHIIIFGGVLHHMLAGFGGGRKYILPGIAGYETIQQNHSLAVKKDGSPHKLVRQGKLWGNPVHEDMNDAARIFLKHKTCTYVAVAANGTGDLFHAQVGDFDTAFLAACRTLDQACCVPVKEKVDFAVISTGGHRADLQLYQSTKALFNAVNVVKEGGEIFFVAGCAQGVGNETFAATLIDYKGKSGILGQDLVKKFNMPAYVALRVMDILNRYHVTLYSDLSREETMDLGFFHAPDTEKYVNELQGKGFVIPFAENILPVLNKA